MGTVGRSRTTTRPIAGFRASWPCATPAIAGYGPAALQLDRRARGDFPRPNCWHVRDAARPAYADLARRIRAPARRQPTRDGMACSAATNRCAPRSSRIVPRHSLPAWPRRCAAAARIAREPIDSRRRPGSRRRHDRRRARHGSSALFDRARKALRRDGDVDSTHGRESAIDLLAHGGL